MWLRRLRTWYRRTVGYRLRPGRRPRVEAVLAVPTLDRLRRACEAVYRAAEAGGYGLDWQAAVRRPGLLREATEAAPDRLLAFAGVGLLRAICEDAEPPLTRLAWLPEPEAVALTRALVSRWVALCEEEVARGAERAHEVWVNTKPLLPEGGAPGIDRLLCREAPEAYERMSTAWPLGDLLAFLDVRGLDAAVERMLGDAKAAMPGAWGAPGRA